MLFCSISFGILIGLAQALPWTIPSFFSSSIWPASRNEFTSAEGLDHGIRVLQIGESEIIEASEYKKLALLRRGVKFFDVTGHGVMKTEELPMVPIYHYPNDTRYDSQVQKLSERIDTQRMQSLLARFTSFYTRYYKSQDGAQSALWLSETIRNITQGLDSKQYEIEHFDHGDWDQFSIIVRFHGCDSPENIIIAGSHQDSMNLLMPSWLPSPGADDNGSGTVTNLEALKVYVEGYVMRGHCPKNTVEFHFYSAEEAGLLGSQDVFRSYYKQNKQVVAMLQQDMTGYVQDPSNEHVGVITDYVSPGLTNFIKLIVSKYLSIPYVETKCGYACSDHGSATKNGYPSAFVIESDYKKTNKYIHTTMDTLDRLSYDHMAQHSRIVIGMIMELGNWEFF